MYSSSYRDSPVIVALDYADQNRALALVDSLNPDHCRLKIGKEMFTRFGPELVKNIQQRGFDIFLDLKFHDIPNTVARAVTAAAELGVWMVNVHACGGRRMMEAARDALHSFGAQAPYLIAVTVLTSMDQSDLLELGIDKSPAAYAEQLALQAQQCGLDGVVCSAHEAASFRKRLGDKYMLVTPGIRPQGSNEDDQRRIMTPQEALQAGVNYMVIGRPVTQSEEPRATLQHILNSLKIT